MARELKQDKKEEYQDASKTLRNYVIMSILIRNPGKFNIIPAHNDGVILDGDISAENVKLPRGCRIVVNNTNSYGETTVGTIYKNNKRIAAFWGKLKDYMSVREARKLVEQLIELNDGDFNVKKRGKRFIIGTDMFLSDIKFPEGFSYKIVFYPSEEDDSYQCQIHGDGNVVFPGTISCKANKNDKVTSPGVLVDDEDKEKKVL